MATTESNAPISYITTTGLSVFAQAIAGDTVTIAKAYFGSDIINTDTQAQLQALNNTVTNGAAGTVYVADSNLITYSFPSTNTVQFKVNLDSTVGNFEIGNWGLVDSNGNMLCITALAKQDSKTATSPTSVGDNRVYTINIPVTSALTANIDFSVISLDAASLPEVATEPGLPAADTASYPVFHVQDYNGTNYPCLASRVDNTWYYYLTIDGILARDNTWTGTDTFNNTVTLNAASYATVAPTSAYSLTDTTIPNAGWVATNYISNRLGMVTSSGDLKGAGLHANSAGIPIYGYYNGTTATSITWKQLATVSYVEGQFLTIDNPTGYGTFTLGGSLGSGSINLGSYTTAGSSIINFFSSGNGSGNADANIIVSGGTEGQLYAGNLTVNSSVFNVSGDLVAYSSAEFKDNVTISANTTMNVGTSPTINTLDLSVPSGSLNKNAQLGFHATFGTGTDTVERLTSVIDTTFSGGSWGDEQLRFWVNDDVNDESSMANMTEVFMLNKYGANIPGALTVGGTLTSGSLSTGSISLNGNIYMNGNSIYESVGGSSIHFESGGHISIYDNSGTLQTFWSMSDGNTSELQVYCYASLNGGAQTTTTDTSDNSAKVATTAYVKNNLASYISGTAGMGSSDSQGTWLHRNGTSGRMNAGYSGGNGDLAWYSDITNTYSWVEGNYLPLSGGSLSGLLNADGGISIYRGTSQTTNSMDLVVPSGGLGRNSQLGFHATFATGTDTRQRLISVIDATFSGGAWGTEQLRFWVNDDVNDDSSMANMTEVFRLNKYGADIPGILTVEGSLTSGSLSLNGNIYMNGNKIYESAGGSCLCFESGGHISVYDNSGTLRTYWSISDGNTPSFQVCCSMNAQQNVNFSNGVTGSVRSGSSNGADYMVINNVMTIGFTFENDATGTNQWITFPVSFSGNATSVVINSMTKDNDCWVWGFTDTGFWMRTPNGGTNSFSALAIGPA